MTRLQLRRLLLAGVLLLLGACGTEGFQPVEPGPDPRDGRAGLRLTGTVAGHQLAVSDGAPALRLASCEFLHQVPSRVCFASRDIDGALVLLALPNADVLPLGETTAVVDSRCSTAAACAEVTDGALVDVVVGERRVRARSGTVTLTTLEEGARYAGSLVVTLPSGRVSGQFDVVPRSD